MRKSFIVLDDKGKNFRESICHLQAVPDKSPVMIAQIRFRAGDKSPRPQLSKSQFVGGNIRKLSVIETWWQMYRGTLARNCEHFTWTHHLSTFASTCATCEHLYTCVNILFTDFYNLITCIMWHLVCTFHAQLMCTKVGDTFAVYSNCANCADWRLKVDWWTQLLV